MSDLTSYTIIINNASWLAVPVAIFITYILLDIRYFFCDIGEERICDISNNYSHKDTFPCLMDEVLSK